MKLFLSALPLVLLLSCSSGSDEIMQVIDQPQQKKIIEVKRDNQLLYKFTYNSAGDISEITNYSSNGAVGSTTKVEYTNGLQTKRSMYSTNNTLLSYHVFTYQGKLITKRAIYTVNAGLETLNNSTEYTNDGTKSSSNLIGVKYYDGAGNLTQKSDIVYTDGNGSSVSDIYNSTGTKTGISTLTKDNAHAWDRVLDPFVYQHETNAKSELTKNLDGTTTGYSVEYTYDSTNYPLTAKYVFTNGVVYNYVFTWQ